MNDLIFSEDIRVSEDTLNALFAKVGWRERYSWYRARENAIAFITVWKGSDLVGMARSAKNIEQYTIYDLAVDPAHQRQAIARELVRRLEMTAKALGYKVVQADSESRAAQELFKALSYREIRRVNHQEIETVYFEKEICR